MKKVILIISLAVIFNLVSLPLGAEAKIIFSYERVRPEAVRVVKPEYFSKDVFASIYQSPFGGSKTSFKSGFKYHRPSFASIYQSAFVN